MYSSFLSTLFSFLSGLGHWRPFCFCARNCRRFMAWEFTHALSDQPFVLNLYSYSAHVWKLHYRCTFQMTEPKLLSWPLLDVFSRRVFCLDFYASAVLIAATTSTATTLKAENKSQSHPQTLVWGYNNDCNTHAYCGIIGIVLSSFGLSQSDWVNWPTLYSNGSCFPSEAFHFCNWRSLQLWWNVFAFKLYISIFHLLWRAPSKWNQSAICRFIFVRKLLNWIKIRTKW